MPLDTPQSIDLIAGDTPLARHPVTLYLGGLRSDQSRRTMTHALQVLAFLLIGRDTDLFLVPWHTLRMQHTTLLATRLSQRYAAATALIDGLHKPVLPPFGHTTCAEPQLVCCLIKE